MAMITVTLATNVPDLKGASAQQLTLTPMLADGTTVMTVAANMGTQVGAFVCKPVGTRHLEVPAGFVQVIVSNSDGQKGRSRAPFSFPATSIRSPCAVP